MPEKPETPSTPPPPKGQPGMFFKIICEPTPELLEALRQGARVVPVGPAKAVDPRKDEK